MMELLNEKVKVAEEEAQTHARKNFEAEEEIRRVRAIAVKVGLVETYGSYSQSLGASHSDAPPIALSFINSIFSERGRTTSNGA